MIVSQGAKRTCLCECTLSVYVTSDIVKLRFLWPGPAPRAGQFFLVKPRRTGVFLARPISVAGWKPRKQAILDGDAGKRRVEGGGVLVFLVAIKGQGTRELAEIRPGEEAELTGPLGNYWPYKELGRRKEEGGIRNEYLNAGQVDVHAPCVDVHAGQVALVGGGAGIAPLLALAAELGRGRGGWTFDFYAGFRSGSFGLEKVKARSLVITTEDGSVGEKGRVTDYFKPEGYSAVFACGPEAMLKAVAGICSGSGIPCFVSVERRMACGVGACLGCTVKTINGNTIGNRRCCVDGPVFNAEEIYFEG